MALVICGPPPCTMTGLIPTRLSKVMSPANESRSSSLVIAEPPYLMTTVLPLKALIYGAASVKILALAIVEAIRLLRALGEVCPVLMRALR